MLIFFIGIGFHSILALPLIIYKHGFKILGLLRKNLFEQKNLFELLYFALAAGIGQEFSKGIPIWAERKRTNKLLPKSPFLWYGLNIGLGFSLSEIIMISIKDWQNRMINYIFSNLFLISFERISATIFHISTAIFIAYGIEKGKIKYIMPICILMHTLLDFIAELSNNFNIMSVKIQELFFFYFFFPFANSGFYLC